MFQRVIHLPRIALDERLHTHRELQLQPRRFARASLGGEISDDFSDLRDLKKSDTIYIL